MAVEVYLGDAPSYVKQWVENYYEKLKEPLCFTAIDAGATIQLAKTGNPDSIEIVVSRDKQTWENYDFTTITLENAEDKVYFKAKTENDVSFFKNFSNYYRFKTTAGKRVAASGNLQTLMKADGSRLDISGKPYCYSNMFSSCTSLTQAPELPATILEYSCYSGMFLNCDSLTQAPALPATTLADYCYSDMFSDCASLMQAPALPATTLADYCYSDMFQDCASLQQAPVLPATTLVDNCYSYMFLGCTSLNSMDVSFTAWDPSSATGNWMFNAGIDASNLVFICPSTLDTSKRDDSHIPDGWDIQTK